MNIGKHLSRLTSLIDKALDEYLPSPKVEPRLIHKAMRYSVFSGGKRIRPIITLEASKACARRPSRHRLKDALTVGCTIELVHTYSLIHDDLPSMDDDDFRRGKPSCHKAFGEAYAILAGDALVTLAFNIITKSMEPRLGMLAIRELSKDIGTSGMVGGQATDLEFKNKKITRGKMNRLIYLKTAKLFEASAKLGAIAAGAGEGQTASLAEYGRSLGMAFQIIDDIIDQEAYIKVFGMEEAVKTAGELTDKAKAALKIFGDKADELKGIADYVLRRAK